MFPSAAEDSSSNGMSGDSSGFEDASAFPPPPPPTEISLLELPPKTLPQPSAETLQIKELEIWPSVSAMPPVQMSTEMEDKGKESVQNGQTLHPPSPPSLPKETTLPPPPPPLPQSDLTTDISMPVQSPAPVIPDSCPAPGKLSPSPGKDGPPLPTKPKPKL